MIRTWKLDWKEKELGPETGYRIQDPDKIVYNSESEKTTGMFVAIQFVSLYLGKCGHTKAWMSSPFTSFIVFNDIDC